jgi:hypothetical protein
VDVAGAEFHVLCVAQFTVGKPLSALAVIRKVHILPTAASMQDVCYSYLLPLLSPFFSSLFRCHSLLPLPLPVRSSPPFFLCFTLSPTDFQMKLDSKTLFTDHLRPYFTGPDPTHICEGEMFVSNGVEFKVLAVCRQQHT